MRRGTGTWRALGAVLLCSAVPAPAAAHEGPDAPPAVAHPLAVPDRCPGAAIRADRVVQGRFRSAHQGRYVLVPFRVPRGTTAVRVKYCYDQPPAPAGDRHTLDLGLYGALRRGGRVWGEREFRGWGGSTHPDVTVSAEGFKSEADYERDPRGHVPGKTTRGFEPGRIRPGRWAVELGVAAVTAPQGGDPDGVAWRVEIELSRNRRFADEPYRAARYDARPARPEPGWYAGDMHVHAEHSSLGDATMRETFEFAFRPLGEGGAGLDFVTLSDYVTDSAWGEIGRFQAAHPGRLIVRSAEVITYEGHWNNHASARYVDYRAGPVYELRRDGAQVLRRDPRAPRHAMRDARRAGGFTQINHPTIFPSSVPGFRSLCRGCPWDHDAGETNYAGVDAIEVHTGPAGASAPGDPGFNPFTLTAIEFWEDKLAAGHRIAAVASSDSHHAGEPQTALQSPIGEGTTVVGAHELSECGVNRAVQAGRTYVKPFGNDGPDLRFEARPPGGGVAGIGDTVRAPSAELSVRAFGLERARAARPGVYTLHLVRDGQPLLALPLTGDDHTFSFPSAGPGRYRVQVQRGPAIEAMTSPIFLEPGTEGVLAQLVRPCARPAQREPRPRRRRRQAPRFTG